MQLDEEPPIELVRGQLVDGEAAALRDGANRVEEMLVVRARGSTCTTTSAGTIVSMLRSTASLAACACSRLAVRGTLMVTSTK